MNRVKEFRERRGLTVEALAERVGVSERLLRALEEDSSVASVEIGFKLAVELAVPFAELFNFADRPGAERIFGLLGGAEAVSSSDFPEDVGEAEAVSSSDFPEDVGEAETVLSSDFPEDVGEAETVSSSDLSEGVGGTKNVSETASASELDAALQKTALDAKKWAEKSAEIAAA